MIAIPFLCDHVRSASKAVRNGAAVLIDFKTSYVENFKERILSVLESSMYELNAKQISKLFQVRPQKPRAVALWGIDYVIRSSSACCSTTIYVINV
ncbi:CLUMA_CG009003, isoform A [Clunio marinus]|uniref:CLUMA_CG009003, isoform A n=1 Tax=Clunio marinus TaxID=568069 RepID=A0A1J1I990_9DIPT|nr:CLUMA_CG009003, isoform A [Clunio marinus]